MDKRTYEERLIAAVLQAAEGFETQKQENRASMQASLAVAGLLRQMVLHRGWRLIVEETGPRLTVFGGATVERHPDGSIKLKGVRYGDLNDLADSLIKEATRAVVEALRVEVAKVVMHLTVESSGADDFFEHVFDGVLYAKHLHVWGTNLRNGGSAKFLFKVMWSRGVLDREVMGLCMQVYGAHPSIQHYNRVCAHREALLRRRQESPNLMACLSDAYSSAHTENVFGDSLFGDASWANARDRFLSVGGTQQGWRWLTKQGAATVQMFWKSLSRVTAKLISDLAAVQCPRVPAASVIMSQSGWFETEEARAVAEQNNIWVVRAMVIAFRARKLKMRDFHLIQGVRDWLAATPGVPVKNKTWATLMRHTDRWHRDVAAKMAEKRRAEGKFYTWSSPVETYARGSWTATALVSTEQLLEEGLQQGHCVGGYDASCVHGRSFIFALTNGKTGRATLELRKEPSGTFRVAQLYAAGNKVVRDKEAEALAKALCSAVNKAIKTKAKNPGLDRQAA